MEWFWNYGTLSEEPEVPAPPEIPPRETPEVTVEFEAPVERKKGCRLIGPTLRLFFCNSYFGRNFDSKH